ncbi:ATP-dependent sacrificial sulfur transferase LarE [Hominifimenecus sp. rT4P-3]|uniref:ATP-dependent sacrificial sulfur transferase LarE n=1 Tax=Hominifimenecus sp. rT4P-3 TaxID=3242979 RepID=UPI003DA58296
MNEKWELLRTRIEELSKKNVCLAFSGGVDSGLLMKLFVDAGAKIQAVMFDTRLHPRADIEGARQLAAECGVPFTLLAVDESTEPSVYQNLPDRCYHCKKKMFSELKRWAAGRGMDQIVEGTNAEDLLAYRPGIRALGELSILSPLAECGLDKAEIRKMAAAVGLSVAEKPSSPCLATRLPYGTPLEPELLHRLEAGEAWFRRQGFRQVRLRYHDPILRIEVESDELEQLFALRKEIVEELKRLDFLYITADLEGFRSGSMDLKQNGKSIE